MGRYIGADLAREAVAKMPGAPAKTMARGLYKQHPEVWKTFDACYSSVRKVLGVHGKENRRRMPNASRAPRQPGNWMAAMEEPLRCFQDAEEYKMPSTRTLILSDVHYPYHDLKALKAAIRWGLDEGVNGVLLNGDFFDFYGCSHWQRDPRVRRFPEEVEGGARFLKLIRDGLSRDLKDVVIVLKEGNHEERWDAYLQAKAPEMFGLPMFDWGKSYALDDLGIVRIREKRRIKLDKSPVNFIHGHEYRFAISNPVNPARGLFLKAKTFAICGHHHQKSEHQGKNIEGKVIRCWSTGCLCQQRAPYAPYNEWSHGAAIHISDKNGFTVHNRQIVDGRVF